ncbi:hypothetical protein FSP39_010675 [Pinctada imbricata]|uniref:Uncharacterized protein n=1 Tax=Pinctada imbricata TaxID=66713 RepID=A0AA88XR47_PINIB|nr:hypothetical protein FSP39_010675 [Pinctada imbricata]
MRRSEQARLRYKEAKIRCKEAKLRCEEAKLRCEEACYNARKRSYDVKKQFNIVHTDIQNSVVLLQTDIQNSVVLLQTDIQNSVVLFQTDIQTSVFLFQTDLDIRVVLFQTDRQTSSFLFQTDIQTIVVLFPTDIHTSVVLLQTGIPGTYLSDKPPDTIICRLCDGVLKDPKILDCLHSFCCNCLTRQHEDAAQSNPVIKCPCCSHSTVVPDGDVTHIPTNVYLKRVLDYRDVATDTLHPSSKCSDCDAGAKYRCLSCKESVCNQHKIKHSHDSHKVRPLNDVLATIRRSKTDSELYGIIFCQKHKDWSTYYCQECGVLMCEQCHRSEHKFHQYTDPKDEGKLVRRITTKRLEEMKEKQKETLERRREIALNLEKMNLVEGDSIKKLETARDALIEEVIHDFKRAEAKVKEIFSGSRKKYISEYERHSRTVEKMSESLNAVETYTKHALDEEMLVLRKVLSDRLKSLESEVDEAKRRDVSCDIPEVIIASSKIGENLFHISEKLTHPQRQKSIPQELAAKVPKATLNDKARFQKADDRLTVKSVRKLIDSSCSVVTDICWMGRSQVAVVDNRQGNIMIFDCAGQLLWERSYNGVQNVTFVENVLVCDSVDAIYPYTKDTKYHRIYVSTKVGPFPVAKSVRCNKIYAGCINEKHIKVYKKDGKKDSVIILQRPFSPSMMALDSNQNIIAVEAAPKSVFKISPTGDITSFFSPRDSNIKIWNPSGLCIDFDDQTYIVNKGNSSLIQVSTNGKLVRILALPFPEPRGISIGHDRKFVSADKNGIVWCFSVP